MADTTHLPIILYHYPFSPYARRVVWYLRLRRIPYLECIQPPILPRPDLALLSVHYRRIPVLSIGRDVYLDTRLILLKLDHFFPPSALHPALSATSPSDLGLQRLLSTWTTSGTLFVRGVQLLDGADLPLLREPAFQRDRADFTGAKSRGTSPHPRNSGEVRSEALSEVRDAFALLETTFLADGRAWVLGGEEPAGPTTADIEAVWVLHWLTGLSGALDAAMVSAEGFPKVYAWIARFQAAVGRAKQDFPGNSRKVTGEEAKDLILGAPFAEEEARVDEGESVVRLYGLEKGTMVEVRPTDSGSAHVDVGSLVGIGAEEIVFVTDAGVRVHAPRHGFRVRPKAASNL